MTGWNSHSLPPRDDSYRWSEMPTAQFCHASRRCGEVRAVNFLIMQSAHDADRDACVVEKVTASPGCRNVLVVTGPAAEEVSKFIVLSAEPVGRAMLLEAAHTLDPSLDPAMVAGKCPSRNILNQMNHL